MSDTSQGPGWWLASDGKWYPPDLTPGAAQPPVPQQPFAGAGAGYPVTVTYAAPMEIARWRALVHLFMAIPHFIILYALGLFSGILTFISFFMVLFTTRVPDGIQDLQAMVMRYSNRVVAFIALLTETYPPFEFDSVRNDPGGYPIATSLVGSGELARVRCLQWILLIPHVIVLYVLGIVGFFAYIIQWFIVLITAKRSEGISNYIIGVTRWATRVQAYGRFLTDQYPPFSLD